MESYPSLLSARTIGKNDLLDQFDEDYDLNSVTTVRTEHGTQTKKKNTTSGVPNGSRKSIKQIIPTQKPKRRKVKLMNWKKYHRLNVIYSFIDELEKDYPAICTVSVIGKSVEGRAIKMLKISNSDASNSAVWLDASIHPREWISTAVLTYIADVIVKNFHNLSTSLTNKDCEEIYREETYRVLDNVVKCERWLPFYAQLSLWTRNKPLHVERVEQHIVPVLNPDGYEYTHTHDRMWRKNKAVHEGEIVGVDLNRNFSYAWGQNGDAGSSDEPNNVFYRGPEPFSEPETVAVRDTILGSTTPFKVFLSFHSYFELIIFPWGHKTEPCTDYLKLLEGATVMARAIYDTTGKTYKVGCTKDMTYYACGTSIDWGYAVAKIPFSYMLELRSKRHRFRLPRDQIIDNCTEIWSAVKSLMDFVDQSTNKTPAYKTL